MPMFGSTTRGKSGMASAPEKDDKATSKGAKAKEDADRGAACSDHRHDKSMSRETSPQQSPSNLCTREHFVLLFGVEVAPTVEDGIRSHILPTYAWSEHIIFDMLSPTIEDISQVMILNPVECLVFRGRHSKGEGFTYGEALALSDAYHRETTTWIGHRVKMHCIMHTLRDARGDLRMVRDQECDKTLEHIWQQYQESEEGGPQTPSHGRGYVCRADHYFAQRFLKKQPERRLGECLAGARDHCNQSREPSHRGWLMQPSSDRPQVCMLTMRCQRRPDGGIPWVEVTCREYHRNFVTPSTLHGRISLIRCQIPIARQKTGMTSLPMTPTHLDAPQWLTRSTAECMTTIEPTNTSVVNDTKDTARLNS